MDWIQRFRNALDYIETNIETVLETDVIASKANTSSFHFQRMFSILSGITLGEYIRRRRLTLAAQELASTDARILDVAVRFGYESQASFTKAFTRLHGFPPGAVRGNEMKIKAYPRLSLKFIIEGDESMEYSVKTIGPIRLVGKAVTVSSRNGENFKRVPEFWEEVMKDGSFEKITGCYDGTGVLDEGTIGACLDFSSDQEEFTYMAAVESGLEELPEGIEERLIPSLDWAVFETQGTLPGAIQNMVKKIYNEWFPATGFEHTGGPELEIYLPPDEPGAPCTRFRIMIPVRKKETN